MALSRLMTGLGFCLLLAVPAVSLLLLWSRKVAEPARLPLAACAAAAVPYAHYAFSRADSVHLSLAILPALLAIFVLILGLQPARRLLSMLGVFGFTFCAVAFSQPAIEYRLLGAAHESVHIGDARIFVGPSKASLYRWTDSVLAENSLTDEGFLALPNLPSLHAAHRVKIPIWEIYALVPRSATFQNKEMADLAAKPPALIIVSDHELDGRHGARFSDYHSHTFAWIKRHYTEQVSTRLPGASDMRVFVRKPAESL